MTVGNGTRGLVLMLVAMATIPISDAIAKHLAMSYPALQIAWLRFAVHAAALAPVVAWRYGFRALWPARPALQMLRGAFLFADVIMFFAALAVLPLADTLALFFISPLVVVMFSALLLKEQVGVRRWLAVGVGLAGALIIIRPGFAQFHWAYLLALGSGVAYALYMVATRGLAGRDRALVTLAHTAIFSACAMAPVVAFLWLPMTLADGLWVLAMGLIAALSHYFLVRAFEFSSASLLAPFTYTEIVWAVLIGLFAFGDFPDGWTWLGTAVIGASGIYIMLRESRGVA